MALSLLYNMVNTFFIAQTQNTNLAAGVSMCSDIVLIYFVFKKSRKLTVSCKNISITGQIFGSIMAIGIPASVTNLMQSFGIALMNRSLVVYGTDKVAAMGIAMCSISVCRKSSKCIRAVVKPAGSCSCSQYVCVVASISILWGYLCASAVGCGYGGDCSLFVYTFVEYRAEVNVTQFMRLF